MKSDKRGEKTFMLASGAGDSYHRLYGGGEGTRTPDPMVANHVLCQLSYTPLAYFRVLPPRYGGPGWIRTTDLTLIRGAL